MPAIPFICIGALIFGPIMLIVGLLEREPDVRYPAPSVAQPSGVTGRPPLEFCRSCGMNNDPAAMFCVNCGASLR